MSTTLAELLLDRGHRAPEADLYTWVDGDAPPSGSLSVGQLLDGAREVAAGLADLRGQPVLVVLPPGLAFVRALWGCFLAGVVAIPVIPPSDPRGIPRVRAIVADAGATFALGDPGIATAARAMGIDNLRWRSVDAVAAHPGAAPPLPGPDDAALVQYTSGSTADPRGIVLTHANLLANLRAISHTFGLRAGDVGVSWLPPWHDMGLVGGLLTPLWIGGTMHLMSPLDFLARPTRWLRRISETGATISGGPDFAWSLCVRRSTEAERASLALGGWRVAFSGAEPVQRATLARFTAAFAPAGFSPSAWLPCYGLAESTLLVTGGRLPDPDRLAPGPGLAPCGAPAPGHEVRVVDPDRAVVLPDGEEGEVWVRGPSVGRGVWRRPDDPSFAGRLADDAAGGPWLRTGDLGWWTPDGLVIAGRVADRIDVRGRKLHPTDLERTAADRAGIRAGGVVAFGEGDAVVLVAEVSEPPDDPSRLAAALGRDVAAAHGVRVAAVHLVGRGELPRTPSGKLRRRPTAAALREGELAVIHRWTTPTRPDVEAIADRLLAGDGGDDRSLSELGLDSLGRAELAEAMSRRGRALPADALAGDPTVGEVRARLGAAPGGQPAAATEGPVGALALSVLSFGADADRDPDALARLARRAEASGFVAIWLPERHFHPFGGACPEPAVAAAALTAHTRTLRLRAGSVLLPLHPPLAVAERWAMVDRLSGGRVELAFAAGWDAASFALAPAAWPGRREALADAVAQVQAAWRGDAVSVVDGRGDPVALRSLPRPIQPELPTWATVAGDPAAWARAGEAGHDVLTALLFQSPAALTEGIARYRAARAAGGHGPGRVCLMLHAAVGVPWAQVRPALRDYLAASVDLWAHEAHVLDALRGPQRDAVLDAAVERVAGLGLFGAPDVCAARAATFAAAGVDELALLVDLGLPEPVVLDSLDAAMRACGVPVASDATPADLPALPPVGQAAPGDPFAAALAWDAPAQARAVDAFPYLVPVEAPVGPRSRVDGAPVWNLSTLDYLGLGADPRVRAAAADAAARWGSTVSGPRVYHGTTAEALTLEARLAAFLGRPAAMTLGSGYLAVLSAVAGLLGPGGALVVDELAHASFFDGAAIAGCAVRRFAHDDPDDLARVLDRLAGRPILVAVEGVYSNEGDVASYGALRAVCGARGVRLLVDDAHGLGVLGRTGRGLEEHAGLPGTADLIVGSLSKALGSTGGFIAGPAAVIEWLRLRARPSLFSASTLPPPAVAAATAGLDILAREPERVAVLGARAAAWRAALARRGVPTLPGVGPLVPIPVGDEARCRALAVDLRRRGVLVSAVIPPSVPPGGARLRTVATWGFDGADEAAERLAQALFA